MFDTPVLDLHRPVPERSGNWFSSLIASILSFVFLSIPILWGQHLMTEWHLPGFNAFLLFPALYLSIASHESGHLVAGRLLGFEPGAISIGAFVYEKAGKKWVFRFDRRMWMCGYFRALAGTTTFEPLRHAGMVAAGPFVNFALAILCGLIFAQYGSGTWDCIGSVFWVSLFVAIFSAIPASVGSNRTDGARLWQMMRHPGQARSWMAMIELQTQSANGVRPREWNAEMVERVLEFDVLACEYPNCQAMAFYRRFDEGRHTEALQHLENALATSGNIEREARRELFWQAAMVSAAVRKRPTQAQVWRDRACRMGATGKSVELLNAAIAQCEGRTRDAMRHWMSARANVVLRSKNSR